MLAGAALLFKQWAAWPALVVLALAPRSKRAQAGLYAYAFPALILTPFLLASHNTWTSLTGRATTLQFGQRQLWTSLVFGHAVLAEDDPPPSRVGRRGRGDRAAARHRPYCDSTKAAMRTIMLVRLVAEPLLLGYNLVPPAALALEWSARTASASAFVRSPRLLLCAFCLPRATPPLLFFAILASGLAYVCGPAVRSWWAPVPSARSPRTSRRMRAQLAATNRGELGGDFA